MISHIYPWQPTHAAHPIPEPSIGTWHGQPSMKCCEWERQPQLLLCPCFCPADCAFHSSAIKADGCLQSPRQWTDGLSSAFQVTLTTTSEHLLTLRLFLAVINPRISFLFCFSLGKPKTYANFSSPRQPPEIQHHFGACCKAELFPNSLVFHLLLNLNWPCTAFVQGLFREGNISPPIYTNYHVACVHIGDYMRSWYCKCLEKPPGSMWTEKERW